MGQTGAKVRATKSRWNFSNKHPRSTPLDPKLMFWCVSYYLGAFGSVWLRNNTYCKTGQTGEKHRAMKSHRNFLQRKLPNLPIEPKLMFWSVFYYLGAFGTVWLPYKTRCKTGQSWCKSSCHDVESEFFATKAPDPPHWTLNSHFGAFRTIRVYLGPFGCLTRHSANRVKLVLKFMPQSRVGIFRNERTRSSPFISKLLFPCNLYYFGAF